VAAVKRVPGVAQVGLVSAYPMRGTLESSLLARFHGEPFDPANNPPGTRQRFAGPGLFEAMGTPILRGRDFSPSDVQTTAPVAVVNKVFADRYLKGRDPIGVQFSAGYPIPNPQAEVTIVGVIGDVRQKSLGEPAEPSYYVPLTQAPLRRTFAVVSMSSSDAGAVERAIRAEVKTFDATMPIDFELASDVVSGTLSRQELGMTLMLVFGGIAIVLAAVGIYGVVSYAGALRRYEMATRLALGASPQSVFLLVMKQGGTLGLLGAGIGLTLAFFSGQIVSSRVYAIRAADPVILGLAALLIAAITFLATMIPAARAARLSPAKALQSD
jgi:hypothetical protein